MGVSRNPWFFEFTSFHLEMQHCCRQRSSINHLPLVAIAQFWSSCVFDRYAGRNLRKLKKMEYDDFRVPSEYKFFRIRQSLELRIRNHFYKDWTITSLYKIHTKINFWVSNFSSSWRSPLRYQQERKVKTMEVPEVCLQYLPKKRRGISKWKSVSKFFQILVNPPC